MTTTTIRLDDNLKKQLQDLAKEMGISFSVLAVAALKKVLEERKVEISAPQTYTLLPEYENKIEEDPDFQETVFVAKTPEDIKTFFNSLEKK